MRAVRALCASVTLVLVGAKPAHGQREAAVRALPASAVHISLRNRAVASVRTTSTGLSVRAGGRRYAVPLDRRVGTWRIDAVRTLAVASWTDTMYLLADVSGRSSSRPDGGGYCGAGTEGDLVWLKLARGRVAEVRTAPYQSCLHGLNGTNDDSYLRTADSVWFDGIRFNGHRAVRIRYYLRQPARGMEALVDTASADSLPRYPLPLAAANVEGEVLLRLIRLPRRLADSVVVVRSTHALFTEAVTNAIVGWETRAFAETTTQTRTASFTFALRDDDGCLAAPARVPGRISLLLGARARLEQSRPDEIRGRIEVCATTTIGRED